MARTAVSAGPSCGAHRNGGDPLCCSHSVLTSVRDQTSGNWIGGVAAGSAVFLSTVLTVVPTQGQDLGRSWAA